MVTAFHHSNRKATKELGHAYLQSQHWGKVQKQEDYWGLLASQTRWKMADSKFSKRSCPGWFYVST